jgi:hypothetical protein
LNRKINILICPLEWGLGHAARMIPVASRLQDLDCRVFVGAGKNHLSLFRSELKDLDYIDFSGFSPAYSAVFPQYLIMLIKSPFLLYHIIRDHYRLNKIISRYNIDIVISDNRFGCWNKRIMSVYVTHMPRIPFPFPWKVLEKVGIILHRWVIRKYDYCMIPDLPGKDNLSGLLSHNLKLPGNIRYTGIMSRFDSLIPGSGKFNFPHNTIILSGPEPQKSILRKKLIAVKKIQDQPTVVLEGKPGLPGEPSVEGMIIMYNHMKTAEMAEVIKTGNLTISRPGYTTLMDLVFLGCTGLLIPTPGQTEQEYLARYLSEKRWFSTIDQKNLKEDIIPRMETPLFPPDIAERSKQLLDDFLDELLKKYEKNRNNAVSC